MGLKRGAIRVAHFAHLDVRDCPETAGETDAHRQAKLAIYQGLRADPRAMNVGLEHYLGICRPDVYFEFSGFKWAVEVQRSHLTVDTVLTRTERYAKMGVAVLWVFTEYPDKLRAWQELIHRAGMTRCYVWQEGAVVLPVHYFRGDVSLQGLPVPICGGMRIVTHPEATSVKVGRKSVVLRPSMWVVDRQPAWWVTRAQRDDPAFKGQMVEEMARAEWGLQQRRAARAGHPTQTFAQWLASRSRQ